MDYDSHIHYRRVRVSFGRDGVNMEAIIVSIITGILSLTGVILTNISGNRKIERQLEVSMAITNTKLEDLTKQVEKHNQVIERTYKLEQAVVDLQRRDIS